MVVFRFIFNFVLFGILFFLIWNYFPDAFATLVNVAKVTVEFLRDFFTQLWERISPSLHKPEAEPVHTAMATVNFLSHVWHSSI